MIIKKKLFKLGKGSQSVVLPRAWLKMMGIKDAIKMEFEEGRIIITK